MINNLMKIMNNNKMNNQMNNKMNKLKLHKKNINNFSITKLKKCLSLISKVNFNKLSKLNIKININHNKYMISNYKL